MVSRKILLQRARLMAGILVLLVGTIPAQGLAQSSRIKDLLRKVDPARIYTDVLDLAALGTRFSASSEFKKATELVRKKLVQAGLRPTLVPFDLPPVRVNNVVVTFPGTRPGAPLLLASAHYDSFSFDPGGVAPGAEDNGSGTAGLLEMARVLAGEKLATGVSLVFFAGEESGLVGSRHMVKDLKSQGKLGTVQAVLNMDMIGYDPGRTRRMVVDAFGVSRGLAGRIHAAAQAYTGLVVSADLYSAGRSDHRPFADEGIPAVNLAGASWRDYAQIHTSGDTPEYVDPALAAEVARANLATILRLAGFADGPPVARAGKFVIAMAGETVRFDPGESFDPLGKALTHRWKQLDGPGVELPAHRGALSFVPGSEGVYRFQLTVISEDGRVSEPDIVAAVVEEEGGCSVSVGAGIGGVGCWWALALLFLLVLRRSRFRD